jgi:hypothetical protein
LSTHDDFRFNAHRYLLDLDATTNQLMMLVVASEVSGPSWSDAVSRQQLAIEGWFRFLSGIQADPMPALDGRATNTTLPNAD